MRRSKVQVLVKPLKQKVMKKIIVEEIEFDDPGKWPRPESYPHEGLFLVKWNPVSKEKALVRNKDGMASWFGIIDEQLIKEEFHSKQESLYPPKRFVSERAMVSEDFALQILSVALHKQKI
jgi:hypothetical protein